MENKTLGELAKENPDKTYRELTEMQENSRLKQEVSVIKKDHKEIDYHRYWKDMYEKERKFRQEVEGELTIVKTITVAQLPALEAATRPLGSSTHSADRKLDPVSRIVIATNIL